MDIVILVCLVMYGAALLWDPAALRNIRRRARFLPNADGLLPVVESRHGLRLIRLMGAAAFLLGAVGLAFTVLEA